MFLCLNTEQYYLKHNYNNIYSSTMRTDTIAEKKKIVEIKN